jgi:hypothetical protein
MIGWRFWVFLAAAIGFVLWAASALVLLEDGSPSLAGKLTGKSISKSISKSTSQLAGPAAGVDAELIREESRAAMRDILRQAEGSE